MNRLWRIIFKSAHVCSCDLCDVGSNEYYAYCIAPKKADVNSTEVMWRIVQAFKDCADFPDKVCDYGFLEQVPNGVGFNGNALSVVFMVREDGTWDELNIATAVYIMNQAWESEKAQVKLEL